MGAPRRPHGVVRAVVWLAVALLVSDGVDARALRSEGSEGANKTRDGFLEKELPLSIVVTSPTELKSGSDSSLRTRDNQAFTVVFSRSVIALGQDFGTVDLPEDKIPFMVEPHVPGRFRWVTTYIGRWDLNGRWPFDSTIKVKLNPNLTTHDGIPLNTTGIGNPLTYTTPTLRMSINGVTSAKAEKATDGSWSARAGFVDDVLPEVPPDGVLQLSFNHVVSVSILAKALQVFEGNTAKEAADTSASKLKLVVSSCSSHSPPVAPCIRCKSNKKKGMTSDETSCVRVAIDGTLKVQTMYTLLLPKGTQYSKRAGPLTFDRRVTFGGLKPFRIPLRPQQRVSSQLLMLDLPHGLAEPNSEGVQALKKQFKLLRVGEDTEQEEEEEEEEIDFDMALRSKGTLEIRAPLMPGVHYSLNVFESDNVLDAFGLPLLASNSSIRAANLGSVFEVLGAFNEMVFEVGQDWGRKLVAAYIGSTPTNPDDEAIEDGPARPRCPDGVEPGTVTATRPIGGNEMKSALATLLNGPPTNSSTLYFRTPGRVLTRGGNDTFGDLAELDISKLLKPTGMVVYERCRTSFYRKYIDVQMVTETDLQATWIASGVGSNLVFVTSMKTGKPVQGAKVMLYRNNFSSFSVQQYDPLNPMHIELIAQRTTGQEGTALFNTSLSGNHLRVELRKKSILMPRLSSGHFNSGPGDVAQLILDRVLVQPGHSVHIKGYALQPTGEEDLSWEPEPLFKPFVTVSPSTDPDKRGADVFPVTMDERFGVFHLEIPIPENAALRPYSIRWSTETSENSRGEFLASAGFTVADPRPPTVQLMIDAPFWARPNTTVEINVIAESFIGSAVGDAEITLKWAISGSNIRGRTQVVTGASSPVRVPSAGLRGNTQVVTTVSRKATVSLSSGDPVRFPSPGLPDLNIRGEMEVLTDASGKGTANIRLGDADRIPSPGHTLSLDASWVGPTGELIKESAFVRLAYADVRLEFARTVATNFPGQEFGARVVLTNLNGVPLPKRNLVLELKKLEEGALQGGPASALEPLAGEVVHSCEIASDSKVYKCRFSLPHVGAFALEACMDVDEGKGGSIIFCSRSFLGHTAEHWAQRPIQDHIVRIGFEVLNPSPSKIGETKKFGFENPFHDVAAVVMWGSNLGTQHKVIQLVDFSYNEVEIEVDEKCLAGCTVKFAVAIPRQMSGAVVNETEIPVSKLFDPAMPHTVFFDASIVVEQDRSFDVDLSFPELLPNNDNDLVVAPGETTTIEVQLPPGQPSVAEVTVVAVDKAILELIPYPLRNLAPSFLYDYTGTFRTESSSEKLIAPSAIDVLTRDFARRKKLNPWFSPVLEARRGLGVDIPDEELVERTRQFITDRGGSVPLPSQLTRSPSPSRSPSSFSGISVASTASVPVSSAQPLLPLPAPAPAFAVASKGRAGTGSAGLGPVDGGGAGPQISFRAQANFVSTVVFQSGAIAEEGGAAVVNFTAPDNLGTFVVRAYASTGTGQFGNAETEVIVRRTVSLTPSAPRFARVGDVFEAGAVVTVSGSAKNRPKVSVKVELEGETSTRLELLHSGERTYEAGADGTDEVRFRFRAKQMGDATLKITAVVGEAGDALVMDFPIEGMQEGVVVATSFAIDGNSSRPWTEGLQLPEAVPGSGGIKLQAGVGRMPVILSTAQRIYARNPEHECPISADHSLALLAIPIITEAYKVMDLDRNALASETLDMLDGMLGNMTAALGSLRAMTTNRFGLTYTLQCPDEEPFDPLHPSIHGNARGVWLLGTLRADIRNSLLEDLDGQRSNSVGLFEETWTAVLSRALVNEAIRARNTRYSRVIHPSTVAIARWALGGDWTPPPGTNETIIHDLSMERLSKTFARLPVDDQAYYIHARLGMVDGINHPDVNKAIKIWTDNIRVGGRTAYIARWSGSPTPASNIGQALALSVMTRAGIRNAFVEKLANYVGGPPTGAYGFRVIGDFDTVVTMITLRDYDVARGSNQPDLSLQVRSGDIDLMKTLFQGNQVVASSSTPWEALASTPKPLEFLARGIGEVTLAASLTFVPARLLPFPTYRGIFVERIMRISGSPMGPSLSTIPLGSVVDVHVQFTSPDSLDPTTLRVLMPAGLEPIDPNVDRSGSSCGLPFFSSFRRSFSYFACPQQETRPSVVTFKYRFLSAGVEAVSFRAVAATVGTFALPPVKAFVDDQPEWMGLSKAGILTICNDCEPIEDTPPKVPRMCPANCNDNGGCDLDSGTCLCLPGFSGDDCGQYTAA